MKIRISRLAMMSGIAIAASLSGAFPAPASAGVFLSPGNRLLVKTEGRKDYKPRIVHCLQSSIDLCIRDSNGMPANNPVEPHADGLSVSFDAWKVTYILREDGTGRSFLDGREVKPFTWSMIPE